MKEFYNENYVSLKKETEEDSEKWKTSHFWLGRTNIVKMAIWSKLVCRVNTGPIKILASFLTEQENKSEIYMKTEEPKKFWIKGAKLGDLTIPDFKLYYKANSN